ncbi:hypothetical protein LOK49_LG07G00698 [Camellia lanceoleosa]|uniref:Uncharacterized protein n=1 Tax=Camellia lanceoleosa TaxID=1840588 RepID=A0ACC0GYN8_9ERIC|nr:hypothetical protein LOK49_LG07G00698 [Camellia lanceoleosa]
MRNQPNEDCKATDRPWTDAVMDVNYADGKKKKINQSLHRALPAERVEFQRLRCWSPPRMRTPVAISSAKVAEIPCKDSSVLLLSRV